MIIYLLKTIACSTIFILVYLIFLEKEKMHGFNRFYLLLSLMATLIIPFLTFEQQQLSVFPIVEKTLPIQGILLQSDLLSAPEPAEINKDYTIVYLIIYALLSAMLFIRFCVLTYILIAKAKKNTSTKFGNSTLILIEDQLVPHSFYKYIFINKYEFERGTIPNEVLIHEQTHIVQKHTFDILIIEFLIILFWFNPILYLYKKAIKLNHEFLADEAAMKHAGCVETYKSLLLRNIKKTQGYSFASQLNFSTTKKRFIMMTKTKSSTHILLKKIALIPVFLILLYLFSEKTIAQKEVVEIEKEKSVENTSSNEATQGINNDEKEGKYLFYAPESNEAATDQQMLEYASIVKKYKSTDGKSWWKDFKKDISIEDHERLESIFLQMNRDQQKRQSVVFIKSMGYLVKKVPSSQQIELWKDPKMYGLWIDEKRVDNSILENYKANDFSHLFVSGLAKNAKNYGKHYYQVDLMTNEYFADFNKKKESEKDTYKMIFHLGSHFTVVNN